MRLVIEIDTENDAYRTSDGSEDRTAIAASINSVLSAFNEALDDGPIRNANGNRVGRWWCDWDEEVETGQ
jgi:hypothetical protein